MTNPNLWHCENCGSEAEPILAKENETGHTCKNCGSKQVAWFRKPIED